ncbi:MAG: hypothetical protein HN742_27290 [Lentisphaerae bacterium]|jgi:predicted Fe-Mo cluster-binding NifX family protein|nr:hypothetical protein [Lentisphaerota bacterium]MBT4823537.1 hypothetical protein [Lentisphaerota bacterium]MBT5612709.1 hypothetical protein [Lentisphaerota bacterium]MBT7060330.1 hypothetical protein [Lentisphaerota bacterium]MBT7845608.1 hypothetical protein [Lentisphaerota bacterium]
MNVALPNWNGRVSPVFDVARCLLVVTVENAVQVSRREWTLDGMLPQQRAKYLRDLGVDLLICGAISAPLEVMLLAEGVRVVPHTCGPIEDVLQAVVSRTLTEQMFLMPGCCGRRRRSRQGRQWLARTKEAATERKEAMPSDDGTGPQGKGPGTGRRRGPCPTGNGQSRLGRPPEAGMEPGMASGNKRGGGRGRGGRGQGRGRNP